MEIKINPLEVAEEFAHQAVITELISVDADEGVEDRLLYIDGNRTIGYTPIAQGCYNRNFDYFFEILTNAQKESNTERARSAKKRILEVSDEKQLELIKFVAYEYFTEDKTPIYQINDLFYIIKIKGNGSY